MEYIYILNPVIIVVSESKISRILHASTTVTFSFLRCEISSISSLEKAKIITAQNFNVDNENDREPHLNSTELVTCIYENNFLISV